MTEAIRPLFRQPDTSTPASEPMLSHQPARAANGAVLRWTPGPDELRLPYCEDEPVPENMRQLGVIFDCLLSLRLHWRGRPDVLVSSDQFIHWDPAYNSRTNPANSPPSPDLYVVFDVSNRLRNSYVVWEEGKPPDFVLEVVSPSSRRRDKEKIDLYAKMGVPEFFLYDPDDKRGPALLGLELRDRGYVPLPEEPLAKGVIGVRSKTLGLCLGIKQSGPESPDSPLCCYDPTTGKFLPTVYDLADDTRKAKEEVAEARTEASTARQEAAEARKAAEARQEVAEAKLESTETKLEASKAEIAELKALIEKMRRS